MLESSAEGSTGTWLAVKPAFNRLLFSGALKKALLATIPQATMTPDGPLEMNRFGCSFDFVPLN